MKIKNLMINSINNKQCQICQKYFNAGSNSAKFCNKCKEQLKQKKETKKSHKQCQLCQKYFDTFSSAVKYCDECREHNKLYKCELCNNYFKEITDHRRHFCDSCKAIKFYCKCGCNKEISFKKRVYNHMFIRGHNRRGQHISQKHKLAFSIANKGRKLTAEHKEAIGKYQRGRKLSESTKLKISQSLKGRVFSKETRQKISKKLLGKIGRHHSIETRQKLSLISSKNIASRLANKLLYLRYKHGYFYSEKNKKNLHYRSSWELQVYKIFEQMSKVINYEVESLRIEYNDLAKGYKRNYIPDLLVTYDDGSKEIIEIKPEKFLKLPTNILKFKAATQYAKEHNMKFNVLTYRDLFKQA